MIGAGEPTWDTGYPDREQLRQEIRAMIDVFLEALPSVFPRDTVLVVWWKGSSMKAWDSPIDYVPELSDVDLHVQLAEDHPELYRYFGSVEDALAIQRRIDAEYHARVPEPLHVPRVQLIVANVLHRMATFVPTPETASKTVFGAHGPPRLIDRAHSRASSLALLLEHEAFLRDLPENIVDKADPYLWTVVRAMTWRVGPTGPRVLEVLGVPYEHAWGVNRTGIMRALLARGQESLAEEYARYYLRGWRSFLSRYEDGDAVREMILAGARVLEQGADIARQVGPALAEK